MDEIFCALAYPTFAVVCFAVWYSPFAMIINLLVWADARNTRGQQGGDSFAAYA